MQQQWKEVKSASHQTPLPTFFRRIMALPQWAGGQEANAFVRACPGSASSSFLSQQITFGLLTLWCHLTGFRRKEGEPGWGKKTLAFSVKPHISWSSSADQVIRCCCCVKHQSLLHLKLPNSLILICWLWRSGQPSTTVATLWRILCYAQSLCHWRPFTSADSWRYYILLGVI